MSVKSILQNRIAVPCKALENDVKNNNAGIGLSRFISSVARGTPVGTRAGNKIQKKPCGIRNTPIPPQHWRTISHRLREPSNRKSQIRPLPSGQDYHTIPVARGNPQYFFSQRRREIPWLGSRLPQIQRT